MRLVVLILLVPSCWSCGDNIRPDIHGEPDAYDVFVPPEDCGHLHAPADSAESPDAMPETDAGHCHHSRGHGHGVGRLKPCHESDDQE